MKYSNFSKSNATVSYDEGLRNYMIGVYNYMTGALILTAIVALFTSSSPAMLSMLYNMNGAGQVTGMSGIGLLASFAPIGFVLALGFGINRMEVKTAQMLFWAYSAVMGLSLSSIFLLYTGESIARVFFITASVFGAMSIYGYTTKKDLTQFGSFLIMGLFGVIIASLINIFLHSNGLQFALSLLSVFIFIGLTAYDTQKIKEMYGYIGDKDMAAKYSVMGALSLYMDFINIFVQLLRFFGERKE